MKPWQYWAGWALVLFLLWAITIGPVFWLQTKTLWMQTQILQELRAIAALLKEIG